MKHVYTASKLKSTFFIVLLILICSAVLSSALIGNSSAKEAVSDPNAVTYNEFLSNYDPVSHQFVPWIIGEYITIEDEIDWVIYDDNNQRTLIWLKSVGTSPSREHLELIGDQSGKYHKGDEIQVKVEIITSAENATWEDYDYTLSDIAHLKKVELDEEIDGIKLFGFQVDLPEALNNDFGRFIIIFSLWIMVGLLAIFIMDPIIRRLVKKSETEIDDIILGIIRKPVLILIILYGLVDSLEELHLPDAIMEYFYTIYGVGFLLMMLWIALKIFKGVLLELGRKWAKKSQKKLEHVLIPVVEKVGSIIILIFGLMSILGYFGIDLQLVLAGSMVMGLVIAFAAQDTLSNFFGGIFLIVEPNFKEDDIIYLQDDYYQVKKIGVRTTQLYDIFKHLIVVVPNNILANEMLINLSEPDRKIKDKVTVGVAYGIDTMLVEKLLLEIAGKHPDIINDQPDRKPFVRFHSFGDSSLDFGLYFWVNDLDDRYRVKHELNHTIHKEFEKHNIEIPFPQRVVTMVNQNQ